MVPLGDAPPGEALAAKFSGKIRAAYPEIQTIEQFEAVATRFAVKIVDLLSDEIDTIERKIRKEVPQARRLDL